MRIMADLHVHSRFSRATSMDMTLPVIAMWARLKGITVVGTGDFTHPGHMASIEDLLTEAGAGLYVLKTGDDREMTRFMLTAEVSNIYTKNGKTRKIHSLIFAPSIGSAKKMTSAFARLGNVSSDGRPIFGFSAEDLLKIVLDASEDAMLVPAHAWTPWFSIFGSKSGFDSIEECFGPLSGHIHAIETGLSSNPMMNWRLSSLDNIALISNSVAHSPRKLGREANCLDCGLDYLEITNAIRKRDKGRFLYTVEFFPEEGKYHHDGHRACGVSFSPDETKKAGGVCPVCKGGLTVGVLSRVTELADRPHGHVPENAIPQRSLVPLQEILSETLQVGVNSGKVMKEYKRLVSALGSEFRILLDSSEEELREVAGEETASAIIKVRKGDIHITPGFDGEFGKIKIFERPEKAPQRLQTQTRLF